LPIIFCICLMLPLGIVDNRMVVLQQKIWCNDQQQGAGENSLCEAEIAAYEAHQ